MASSAVVGALRVILGIDAAEVQTGAAQAVTALKKIEAAVLGVGSNVTGQFLKIGAGIAAAFGPAAVGYAIKQAMNLADETYKMAQSVGLSSEQLSRLEYSATLAGLSQEDLRKGLVKLSESFEEAKDKTSEQARAYAALGISTQTGVVAQRDLLGTLRLVADRFSQVADGANKTTIAGDLLGARMGSKWIPLLNGSAAGLEEMAKQSDALGRTIDTETAKAAEKFNDTLSELHKIQEAVALQIAARLLPAFQLYADKLKEVSGDSKAMKVVSDAVATAIEYIARIVSGAVLSISRFVVELQAAFELLKALGSFDTTKIREAWDAFQAEGQKTRDLMDELRRVNDEVWSGAEKNAKKASEWITSVEKPQQKAKQTTEEQRRAQEAYNQSLLQTALSAGTMGSSLEGVRAIQEALSKDQLTYAGMTGQTMELIKAALASGKITWQEYKQIAGEAINIQRQFDLDELNDVLERGNAMTIEKMQALQIALAKGAISYREYGKNVKEVERGNQQNILDTATMFGSTLTTVFRKSKLAAAAQAAINTAVGITKAMELPFPFNWAQAALIAASGVAQIATIRSSSETGGASTPSAPAGGGAANAGVAAPAAQEAQRQAVSISINGSSFGREQVRELIERINEATADGARLVIV